MENQELKLTEEKPMESKKRNLKEERNMNNQPEKVTEKKAVAELKVVTNEVKEMEEKTMKNDKTKLDEVLEVEDNTLAEREAREEREIKNILSNTLEETTGKTTGGTIMEGLLRDKLVFLKNISGRIIELYNMVESYEVISFPYEFIDMQQKLSESHYYIQSQIDDIQRLLNEIKK